MRFEVSDDTRQAADCPYGYPCLTDEEWVGCAIDNCVGGTVLFIRGETEILCRNMRNFGYEHICMCPVRREIFQRYGV